MSDLNKYRGVIPAFYACYDDEGNISPERVRGLTRYLIGKGVNGLYVGGSSGECIYQGVEERKVVLENVMAEAKGKVVIIAHVACNNTADSRELAAHAESLGVDAIAAIPPIYFHLPEYAIAQYWNDISAAAPNTDFVIYNIPQLAGVALTPSLLKEMQKNPRVIAVKNSSMPVQDIQMWKDAGVLVFNGPDEQYISGLAMGACAGIGGTYAVMPELFLKVYEHFQKGEMEQDVRGPRQPVCRAEGHPGQERRALRLRPQAHARPHRQRHRCGGGGPRHDRRRHRQILLTNRSLLNMRIYQAEDYKAMSRRAANIISAQVIYKPNCVLGLATGGTPVGLYKQLVDWYKKGDLSFAETRSVNLDEYLGLSPHHEQSYRYFMQVNLFDHIDIKPENTHVLDGLAKNPQAECTAYNRLIRDLGGIDLQLLGMGHNGHIAFNEPGDDFGLETHVVDLTDSTIDANQRFFESRDEVPRHALSMGIKNIMNARRILMVVSGEEKADIVCRAFAGPVTKEVPASVLQLHPDVTLVGDKAALHKLAEAGVPVCG